MKKLTVLAVLIALTLSAKAQDTRPYELVTADEQLNAVYQQILKKMHPEDQAKFRKAQRAWIAFRDLDCAWSFARVPLDCKIIRTEERTKALEETYFSDAKGNYVSVEAREK
jgi:uncharacterized protein YecT (DUF1311 family)